MLYTFQKITHRKRITVLDAAMAGCSIILLFTSARIPGALLLLTAIIGIVTKRPDVFIVDETGITWKAFRKKKYPWSSVHQVILKDGMLTIDLKNNTLIQVEVQNPSMPVQEHDFNQYCKQYTDSHTE